MLKFVEGIHLTIVFSLMFIETFLLFTIQSEVIGFTVNVPKTSTCAT